MKLLSAQQTRELDSRSILEKGMTSTELMEHAATIFYNWMLEKIDHQIVDHLIVFCGTGNNGGDGAVIARIATQDFTKVSLIQCHISAKLSPDLQYMKEKLPDSVQIIDVEEGDNFTIDLNECMIVDAVFGSGLSREVTGYWKDLFDWINNSKNSSKIFAVDVPSGLFGDIPNNGHGIINADYTLSFEMPKRSFFWPENESYVGIFESRSIGLSNKVLDELESTIHYIDSKLIQSLFVKRKIHSHKGTYGHAAMICGSHGMTGAAILAGKACLRTGVGKITCYLPDVSVDAMQIAVPEAMVNIGNGRDCIRIIDIDNNYNSIGIGCGIGQDPKTVRAMDKFLEVENLPLMIIDADALNIIALNNWMARIPRQSIITPHPGEFQRLFGSSVNTFEREKLQIRRSKELGVYIVCKRAYTTISTPEGYLYYNKTGNPGMATAGSGDVLTGVLTSLLAQGYSPQDTCVLGVYLHGLAGDISANKRGEYGLIASDIISSLPAAIKELEN